MENLSDREYERFLQENNAGKWFAGFDLTDPTPDYSTLCRFRNDLGCEKIELLFKAVQTQLREKGYFSDAFKFVDATALIRPLQPVRAARRRDKSGLRQA